MAVPGPELAPTVRGRTPCARLLPSAAAAAAPSRGGGRALRFARLRRRRARLVQHVSRPQARWRPPRWVSVPGLVADAAGAHQCLRRARGPGGRGAGLRGGDGRRARPHSRRHPARPASASVGHELRVRDAGGRPSGLVPGRRGRSPRAAHPDQPSRSAGGRARLPLLRGPRRAGAASCQGHGPNGRDRERARCGSRTPAELAAHATRTRRRRGRLRQAVARPAAAASDGALSRRAVSRGHERGDPQAHRRCGRVRARVRPSDAVWLGEAAVRSGAGADRRASLPSAGRSRTTATLRAIASRGTRGSSGYPTSPGSTRRSISSGSTTTRSRTTVGIEISTSLWSSSPAICIRARS